MTLTRRQLLKTAAGGSLAACLPLPLLAAWAAEPAPANTLPLAIHSEGGPHRLDVEVAETASQRQRGLMGREHLPETRGMLFRFESEQPAGNAFWMYRISLISTAKGASSPSTPCRPANLMLLRSAPLILPGRPIMRRWKLTRATLLNVAYR